MKTKFYVVAGIVLLLAGLAAVPLADITNFDGLHLSGTFGTATPQLLLQNNGTSNSFEIRDANTTPVVSVDADGNAVFLADVDLSGADVSGVSTTTLASLEVTGNAIANTLGITGVTTLKNNLIVDGTVGVTGAVTFGADGTAADVTFYSDTTGDYMLYDQSEEALTIIGTNGQDALNVDDGNVDIEDDVDVNGTTNLDDVDIDLSASLNIDGHMLDVGSGTYTLADGDNDVGIDGDLEANGAANIAGNLTLGAATIWSTASITPTDGAVFTPTTSIVNLTAAAEVTPTIAACTDGAQLILYGGANQTVNLADGDNFVLASAVVLGQYDALRLACIANKWVQLSAVSAN